MSGKHWMMAAGLFFSEAALAADVSVAVDTSAAAGIGLDAGSIESELQTAAGSSLNLGDQQTFLEQMAGATLMSIKGQGVDYASNMQRFVGGVSIGTGVNATGASFSRGDDPLPSGGFAFQMSAMAGINLGLAAGDDSFARRVKIYVNGMAINTNPEPFEASARNIGGHVQLKLIKHRKVPGMEWGGLDFTTGYESTWYNMTLNQAIPVDGGLTQWDADGTYSVSANGQSIPLELSTSMRVLALTVFGGYALDYNVKAIGSSTIELSGPISADDIELGSASISSGATGNYLPVTQRFFVGTQMNILMVKLYGQVNFGMDEGFGGHIGARIAI